MLVERTGQEVKTTEGRVRNVNLQGKELEMSIKMHFRAVILRLERATRSELLNY